ncbi:MULTISPECIES: DUF3560 domain-containing protein [unclassified Nonomuraea]|uniref:DUF3560 domain-containing protein n=1 Tax=unclassified Nonomuraea TaxID=2593643 RepID=UPI0033CDE713
MITIHVSPAQGLIVTGTTPELRHLLGRQEGGRQEGGLGLLWSDRIVHNGQRGAWYEPHSRDQHPSRHQARVREIADALRAVGHQVAIDVTGQTRSVAAAEADLYERADTRAGAYRGFAANAQARAEEHRAAAQAATAGYPPGQPILLGHPSQRRHENAIERNHAHTRKAIAESDRAQYWRTRAKAAEHLQQHRRNPRATMRRIERLETDLRRVQRRLSGEAHPRLVERDGQAVLNEQGRPLVQWQPATGSYRDQLLHEQTLILEKIGYWKDLIAKAEADGVKVWGPDDFTVGDFVLYLGTWYEVLRVNTKSLTVPTGPLEPGRQMVRQADNVDRFGQPSTSTGRLPYHEAQDRMSPAEAAQQFPPAESTT